MQKSIYRSYRLKSKGYSEKESKWIESINYGLKENLFILYAQPITSISDNSSKKHFEILLRLQDSNKRIIPPSSFLHIAERNSLMPSIDTWVINNLFEILASRGSDLYWRDYQFSINLSGASLNSDLFLDFVTDKLSNSDLSPQLFCFEITEEIAIENIEKVRQFIYTMKNLGCSFALDDFGKGMSSLSYLKNLPVDYLKIDGSFISELDTDNISRIMVEAISHIAVGIGLKTVAEFVENKDILDALRDLKIDYAQGYHLGRPQKFALIV